MLFTIKRPKSQRFFQLSFQGLKPGGRNKIEEIFTLLSNFFAAWYLYLTKRFIQVLLLPLRLLYLVGLLIQKVKSFTVKKLIWSRGRLGRPIANFVVLNLAFLVFIFGKVLNSSKFVNSQELDKDYLAVVTDIIPQRNIATTVLPADRQRTEPLAYIVEPGDTLSDIGNKFKISVDALRYVNNLAESAVLRIGQEVLIPPVSGLVHKVESGDTLRSIASKYDVPSQAIADFNYILDTSKLAVGTELVIPGAKVPRLAPVIVIPAVVSGLSGTDSNPVKGLFIWPTSARVVTQEFSWYHNGVDIATPISSTMPPIYASYDGVVTRAGWDPWGLGLHIRISHANGYETIYGHMSRLDVGYGEKVSRGQVLGLMGSTGRSTGPHIHFIINYNHLPQNPLNYIN